MEVKIIKRNGLEADKKWILENVNKKTLLFIRPAKTPKGGFGISSSEVRKMTLENMATALEDPKYVLIEVILSEEEI